MERPPMEIIVGIDVSKKTLDAFVQGRERRFANTPAGFGQLLKWAKDADLFVMEATGAHHVALADRLSDEGRKVSVVNPQRASHYAKALGLVSKTDRADARVLATYAERNEVPLYAPESPSAKRLKKLVRHRSRLTESKGCLKRILKEPGLDALEIRQIKEQSRFLQKQIERNEQEIYDLVSRDEALKENFELLRTIPGLGPVTALVILSEGGELSRFQSAKQFASFAGVHPRVRQSGTSLASRPRMSKSGCAALRKALYMSALTAVRREGPCRALFERLLAKGKTKLAALGAVMHKQLRIAFGVAVRRKPFSLQRTALTT
jgi:transposase